MKKCVICWLVICLLFSACDVKHTDSFTQDYAAQMEAISEEHLELQKKLLRWYNTNLQSSHPEVGFERSYDSILYFADGIMGYVYIPKTEQEVPIYHDLRSEAFYLNPYSAFPIGGPGNHSRLVTENHLDLKDGDIFYIYLLDEIFRYTVGGEGDSTCDLICDGICYRGTSIVED